MQIPDKLYPTPSEAISQDLSERMHDLGIGELTTEEIQSVFASLQRQIQIGLDRPGEPTTEDGGVLAIKTGIPPVTPEVWENKVPHDATAYVLDIGGTNWTIKKAQRQDDGSVELSDIASKTYDALERKVTFDEFVSRIATLIHNAVEDQTKPIAIGISLGFPHKNKVTATGIDAELISSTDDGTLPKEWKITDWDPTHPANVTAALRERLGEMNISVGTLVAINDTPAVALDGGAIQEATQKGLDVIAAGFVGGTGTNGAMDHHGLVNLEIGHATFPSDAVYDKMKEHNWTQASSVFETQTGGYLPWRLAAAMELLRTENPACFDQELYDELKPPTDPNATVDQALLSKIASGERSASPQIQALAQAVLKRAGQVYGIMLAAIAEATPSASTSQHQRAFVAEGGVLLNAHSVKDAAEETAATLEQPLLIRPAVGLKGVASLAMAYAPLLELQQEQVLQEASDALLETYRKLSSLPEGVQSQRLHLLQTWLQQQGQELQELPEYLTYAYAYMTLPTGQRADFDTWVATQPTTPQEDSK